MSPRTAAQPMVGLMLRVSPELSGAIIAYHKDTAAKSKNAAVCELLQRGLVTPITVAVLEAIRDYEPNEVAKDEFAYDRMVENFRAAARKGLAEIAALA